jgi:hypothetical protein
MIPKWNAVPFSGLPLEYFTISISFIEINMFLTKRQVIATIRQIKTSKDKFFKRLKEL